VIDGSPVDAGYSHNQGTPPNSLADQHLLDGDVTGV
jgi:hypothetical protein